MFDSVRIRLTLWYAGVLAVLLLGFSTGVYVFLRGHFFERADGILKSVGSATISIMRQNLNDGDSEEMAARKAIAILDFPKHSLAVFAPNGRVLAERPLGFVPQTPLPPDARKLPADRKFHMYTVTSTGPDPELRRIAIQAMAMAPSDKTYLIVTSRSLTPLIGELETNRLVLAISVPAGVLIAGLAGWFLSRKSLAPVLAMADQAHRIGAENLDRRLAVNNPRDELGQLAATFNDLLSRLSAAFAQQRQFMADASHELRTPISVMRTSASVILERPHRGEEEYRSALSIVDEQSRRLSRIVEDMFRLARADAGRLALQTRFFYLDELIGESARAASVLAATRGMELHVPALPESPFRGDEDLLRRMLLNVLENAVKHTPDGGRVALDLETSGDEYKVRISDNGTGIPAAAQSHIFERFYRVDRGLPGAGLGLPIARSIAEAHGGTLTLVKSGEEGSTFLAVLPRTR